MHCIIVTRCLLVLSLLAAESRQILAPAPPRNHKLGEDALEGFIAMFQSNTTLTKLMWKALGRAWFIGYGWQVDFFYTE